MLVKMSPERGRGAGGGESILELGIEKKLEQKGTGRSEVWARPLEEKGSGVSFS